MSNGVLERFHPAVALWFKEALGEPTSPQERAWPILLEGSDALVAAPTGSGKTLAAFLASLDALAREAERGGLVDEVRVVYVSPLKALSNDVHKNLMLPLAGLKARLEPTAPELRAAVRTGDTEGKERAKVLKRPPHVLVTTPESLYVLLTSSSGRKMLSTARTLILDEIHAVAGSRRGAHLALTVERLEHLVKTTTGRSLQRVGLSATQKPVEEIARFLVGTQGVAPDGIPRCAIVDEGHARKLDLELEVPPSPLESVMSHEVWSEVLAKVADLVVSHRTTLVFVNSRRLAERVSARLGEHVGERLPEQRGHRLVCAHHGSMSKDKRFDAEQRLKEGKLRALVATSSLELGIDVGSVDLVIQLGVTKSIAALLQRVGRAGHHKSLVPKGRVFPLTRDELLEATALVGAVRTGDLDAIEVPCGGLDVLAQQLVACASEEDWHRDELHALAKRAWPYRDLGEKDFNDALGLVAQGVQTQRGRRGAHLFLDAATGAVRGRKGARLAALTSGGAIPDLGDYLVVESPTGMTVGTINEDFAIESTAGDIFQLGATSWRILKVERGVMRVEDAKGQPPSLPFWLGEAPARTRELSHHLSTLREDVEQRAARGDDVVAIAAFLSHEASVPLAGALQAAEYLLATRAALGTLPTTRRVVFERFLDELGGSQIVVHAPFGARITRAWGLAQRKRFCRSFDFELQAAATEDALLLSVGAVQGVDITALPHFLSAKSVKHVLEQAVLDAPMFGTRFRWNATRALTMLRMRGGKRVPPGFQRIEAEDLLVSLFPEQQACLENIVGDREIPDALLVRQTMHDCLHEYMDISGLEQVLAQMEQGLIEVRCVESTEPSPLAYEILQAKPYAFLDDAPLEERRVQAVLTRRTLDAANQGEDPTLDQRLVAEVLSEVHPPVETADEACDALALSGYLRETELHGVGGARMPALVDELMTVGRVRKAAVGPKAALIALEREPLMRALGVVSGAAADADPRKALLEVLRARAEVTAPRTAAEHAVELGLPLDHVQSCLAELVRKGELLQGRFDHQKSEECTWSRRLVTRVRGRALEKLRADIEPVAPRDLMRFLLRWQHAEDPMRGLDGLRKVLARLDGVSAPAAAWEEDVLPARVADYDPAWLDQLCLSGHLEWARVEGNRGGVPLTLRNTPIAFVERVHAALFRRESFDDTNLGSPARAVLALLKGRGASFFGDLVRGARLLPSHAEAALAELVAAGLVTSDSTSGLRALLLTAKDRDRLRRRARGRLALSVDGGIEVAGRWALAAQAAPVDDNLQDDEARAEAVARVLLQRTGVVFRKLVEREAGLPPWRDLLWALRRLEARGEIRGGRFVTGFSGEQFALPEAIPVLRETRRAPLEHKRVVLSAADPLNLTGVILPHARVPAVASHRILLEDGIPIAVLDGSGVRFLGDTSDRAAVEDLLVRERRSA